jgi:hypothetical protein
MGSSFVEFRGRGFWAKDTPLQAAMYLLHCELRDRSAVSEALGRWRDTLMVQARWGGGGCVWSGLQDFSDDQAGEALADVVRGAQARQSAQLTTHELAEARIAMSDYAGAEHFWRGVEQDAGTRNAVSMILAAFLELVGGEIDPRYGRLVHDAESEDANSRTLPGEDVRISRAREEARSAELLRGPFASSSFGPDPEVPFVHREGRDTAGER